MTRTACRLVVFDLFGTLVAEDGSVDASLGRVLAEHRIGHDAETIARVRGLAKRDALRNLAGDRPALEVDALYAAFHHELRARWASQPLRAADGAAEVFAWLEAHAVRLAITTGLDRDLADRVIDACGWSIRRFAVVCAGDVRQGRPAPDMIRTAMTRTGVKVPDAVACVGDTAADLRAAAAAGVRWNVAVLGGAHPASRLRTEPHTAMIASLRELPAVIGLAVEDPDGR